MTDREEFEKWLFNDEPRESDEQIKFDLPEYNFAWWAWLARGELDAVRIKEWQDIASKYAIYEEQADVKIAELTAKNKELRGYIKMMDAQLIRHGVTYKLDGISISKALQELDK